MRNNTPTAVGIIITIVCLLAALATSAIPLLGIDHSAATENINRRAIGGVIEAKTFFGGVDTGVINATWIGLLPAFLAMTLVRLLFVLVAPLRRASRTGKLNWIGWAELGLTLPLALILAGLYCSQFAAARLLSHGPVLPILHFTVTSMVLVGLAHIINLVGRGNGFVLIPAAAWLTGLPLLFRMLWSMFSSPRGTPAMYSPFHALALIVISTLVVAGLFFLARRWTRRSTKPVRGRDSMGLILAVLMAVAIFHVTVLLPFRWPSLYSPILLALLTAGCCWLVLAGQARDRMGSEHRERRTWVLVTGTAILVSLPMILGHKLNIPYDVQNMLVGTGLIAFAGALLMLRPSSHKAS